MSYEADSVATRPTISFNDLRAAHFAIRLCCYQFATNCRPDGFNVRKKPIRNAGCNAVEVLRPEVGVDIHREACRGVTHEALNSFGRLVTGDQGRCIPVPQPREPQVHLQFPPLSTSLPGTGV